MLYYSDAVLQRIGSFIWGWPLVIGVSTISIIFTIALNFIQFRYFTASWKYLLFSDHTARTNPEYITPFQAFMNTLNASIGNGSLAGMATAIASGGPGAAFWVFILGFFTMAIRYAEVYASTSFTDTTAAGLWRGGPMVFLGKVPGKRILPLLYAVSCLLVSFIAGSALQCNSMRLGIERITHAEPSMIAFALFAFLAYIMLGGAQRIIKISNTLVPLKVGLFFVTILIVLVYHYRMLDDALFLIIKSALKPQAVTSGIAGYSIKQALRFGISRKLSATEVGLGTAGVLFGATKAVNPWRNAIMSMASVVVSNHLVCFMLMLALVASGVWDSGLTSIALTSAAYETVFGSIGAWIVTFLSIIFGMGVMISYAYIGRECWRFITGGRFLWLYSIIYCMMALVGSLGNVESIWSAVDSANAGMLVINLYGLLMLLPWLRRELRAQELTPV